MSFLILGPVELEDLPGREALSGSELVYQRFQSRGYCSNEATMPWKFGNLVENKLIQMNYSVI